MGSLSFSDIYEQAETGSANGIAGGVYDVEVVDTRLNVPSNQIWLDLSVLNGPAAGQIIQVSLNFPQPGQKPGVFFHYRRKIAGFLGEDVKAAFVRADSAATPEAAYSIIAEALVGKRVSAKVSLQTEEGPYKGTNNLDATTALNGAAPAPAPATTEAAPAPAVEAAPAAPAAAAAPAADSEMPF